MRSSPASEKPFKAEGGLAIVRGNPAPSGAVIKQSAASQQLLQHRGRAVVFTSLKDWAARVDDPALDIGPDDVMVLQNAGPIGGPGMPEAGYLPIPKKLLAKGVRDMVRMSDARMSGTAFGTVALGMYRRRRRWAARLDWCTVAMRSSSMCSHRRIELHVPDHELNARRMQWQPPPPAYARGYGKLFLDHVLQAHRGCDFDFLLPEGER